MFNIVSFGLVFSSNIFGSLFSPNFTFFVSFYLLFALFFPW